MAARLLAHAPSTEAALEARLLAKGYSARTASATVARCRELGWVGDDAFARERARALRRRGAGPLRIEADLTARGLPESLVSAAVEESRDGLAEREWARRALERLRAPAPARAWRWLLGQGFPEDAVADVVGEPE